MRRGRWLEVCWYAVLSAVALAANLTHGAQFYVAPGGSNASAGTAAAPWATLQHAADVVGPGDRVVVRSGNYKGFYLDTSGAAGSPIEFFAEPGVLINVPTDGAGNRDGINLEGASHVVIDGFSVTGMPRAGVRSVGLASRMAEFVTIRNVHATNNGYWGIFTGHVNDLVIENNETSGSTIEHGIYVSNSGDRPVIRGNKSWGNRANGIHMNGDLSQGGDGVISGALVSGNTIWNNGLGGGSGINMDGVQNSRIENNLIYDAHASGISLYRIDGGGPSSGNTIVNNTIHQASNGRWALNIQGDYDDPEAVGAINTTILNNVLLSQHGFRGAIDISPSSLPGLESDYNALISRFTTSDSDVILNLAQWQAETGQDAHSFVATPAALFEDWAAGDYRLRVGSPAINKGTDGEAPAVDLFGRPRPAGAVDIGAIEFGATLTADFNDDGRVDGADLAAWGEAFGETTAADADGDTDVDGADFLIWQRELGAGVVGGQAIPEPATIALGAAALGLLGLSGRRWAVPG
jgi:hypothetical protein